MRLVIAAIFKKNEMETGFLTSAVYMMQYVIFTGLCILTLTMTGSAAAAEGALNQSETIVAQIERQVLGALDECSTAGAIAGVYRISGALTPGTPQLRPAAAPGLSPKYQCAVACDLVVRESGTEDVIVRVSRTFSDIGRSRKSARRFALGKVVRYLFENLRDRPVTGSAPGTPLPVFADLEKQNQVLERRITTLAAFVDQIVDCSARAAESLPADTIPPDRID